LGINDYSIKVNHRGVLSGIAEAIGAKENEMALFVAIDKLDKIGEENVRTELQSKGFSKEGLDKLFVILNTKGSNKSKLDELRSIFNTGEAGSKGIKDLTEVFSLTELSGGKLDHVDFDIALARGLSYYTGCIFEVKVNNVTIGSVSGGGRYDNLTKAFGDKDNLSGVGFSFGVDRLYDVLDELKLFPEGTTSSSRVLVCHFDQQGLAYGLGVVNRLRGAGVASEIYPDVSKIKKQLDYANRKNIPNCIIIGSEEIESGILTFKDMVKGTQEKLSVSDLLIKLKD
jgi:histidyl-tRNA synthetase